MKKINLSSLKHKLFSLSRENILPKLQEEACYSPRPSAVAHASIIFSISAIVAFDFFSNDSQLSIYGVL